MRNVSNSVWRDHVHSVTNKTRAMTAAKASRISPSAMAEVLSALDDYWGALEATDLKERSKGIYMSMADNFVRWMRNEFVPGCRSTVYGFPPRHIKRRQEPARTEGAVGVCRCGHSSESHIYPGSIQYGDCHLCECELYNPAGGIKGLPIHPLFSFTEDEFRMVACIQCGRFRVVPEDVCENCEWDNDNNGQVEQTRPEYCRHSPTRQHEVTSGSSQCRYCLRTISTTPGTHGTHERWETGCDCNDCRGAMLQWFVSCGIAPSLVASLRDLLVFRRNVNELWLTTNSLKKDALRQNIDKLVRLGILSRGSNEVNRGYMYLLHFEQVQQRNVS